MATTITEAGTGEIRSHRGTFVATEDDPWAHLVRKVRQDVDQTHDVVVVGQTIEIAMTPGVQAVPVPVPVVVVEETWIGVGEEGGHLLDGEGMIAEHHHLELSPSGTSIIWTENATEAVHAI